MSLETPFLRNVVATKTVLVIVTQMTSESQQGSAAFNTSKPNILIKYMEIIDTSTLRLLNSLLTVSKLLLFPGGLK